MSKNRLNDFYELKRAEKKAERVDIVMFNDIIEGKGETCENCWWAIVQGHNPISQTGKVYCNLNKKDYRKEYHCRSWRHKTTREPKLKINLNT